MHGSTRRRLLERLRPVLENPHVAKVNQNIKYDLAGAPPAAASCWPAWPAIRWWPITCCTPASAATTWTDLSSRYLESPGHPDHRPDRQEARTSSAWTRCRRPRWPSIPARMPTWPGGLRTCSSRSWPPQGLKKLYDEAGNPADRGAGRAGIQRHPARCAAAETH